MKKIKCIAWLYQELPSLIRNGILSEDSAAKLKDYYGEVNTRNKMQLALTIFGVVGAVCVGLGVMLLFAYNWDNLTRTGRTVLAFTPLVLSLLMCAWAVFKDKKSASIREGFSVFNMLSVGGAIALISQIYHMPGDIDSFMLIWMLLALPLVYLMQSSLVAFLYMIGVTTWAGMAQVSGGHALLFWPLVAAVIPHYLKYFKQDRASFIAVWLSSVICLCLSVGIGISLEKVLPGLWIIVYAAFFGILYMISRLFFVDDTVAFWQKPFRNYGMMGLVVLSYLFTFEWVWDSIGWSYYRHASHFHDVVGVVDYIIAGVLVITAVSLLVRLGKEKNLFHISFSIMPLLAILCYSFSGFGGNELFSVWIFNLYVLYTGIICVVVGIKERQLGMTNAGILIMGNIIFTRFLDSSLGIIERGIVFILIGVCFIGTNIFLSKKLGISHKED